MFHSNGTKIIKLHKDAVIPNETGITVPIKNPKKLAYALKWLIENPKELAIMGKNGRKLAENKFDIKNIVQNHLNLYDDLINNLS